MTSCLKVLNNRLILKEFLLVQDTKEVTREVVSGRSEMLFRLLRATFLAVLVGKFRGIGR